MLGGLALPPSAPWAQRWQQVGRAAVAGAAGVGELRVPALQRGQPLSKRDVVCVITPAERCLFAPC